MSMSIARSAPGAARRAALALAMILVAGLAFAQVPPSSPVAPKASADDEEFSRLMKRLGLDAKELKSLEAILDKDQEALDKAKAEIRICQAELSRLLLEKEVPMDKVQALVKESLDWEYQVRMIQIRRQIEIRKILGDGRWGYLFKLGRAFPAFEMQGRAKAFKLGGGKPEEERLVEIVKRLN